MSSPTKILDNAIVGYCVRQGLVSESTRHAKNKRVHDKALKRAKEIFGDARGQSRKGIAVVPKNHHGSYADRVRAFVMDVYIEPARTSGQTEVRVRAGDVDKALGFGYRRLPLICAALRAKNFSRPPVFDCLTKAVRQAVPVQPRPSLTNCLPLPTLHEPDLSGDWPCTIFAARVGGISRETRLRPLACDVIRWQV